MMKRRQFLAASGAVLACGAGCLWQTPPQEQSDTTGTADTQQKDTETSSDGGGQQSGSGATLADAKLQLEGYQDSERAVADGYERVDTCIKGLGIPFVNDDVSQVSYDLPNTLLYEQSGSDQYELMGVEYFVPAADTDEPPALFAGEDRHTFRGPMEGHYQSQPTHYGLHVWLFTENPNGQFARSNPRVTCPD